MKQIFALGLALALAACGGSKPTTDSSATTTTPAATASADGPPDSFIQCAVCHKVGKDEGNLIGPNLHGVVGRKAGTVAGFAYSPAMKEWGQTWTEANLDKFLANPQAMIAGTKMSYAGQADAAKRKEIIEYLKKNK